MITRNLSTEASREFWRRVEESAREVATWPNWKRAGINVSRWEGDDESREFWAHVDACAKGSKTPTSGVNSVEVRARRR